VLSDVMLHVRVPLFHLSLCFKYPGRSIHPGISYCDVIKKPDINVYSSALFQRTSPPFKFKVREPLPTESAVAIIPWGTVFRPGLMSPLNLEEA
jgi:hypothetical protein